MQLISAVLHNIIALVALVFAASFVTMSVPRKYYYVSWGVAWGLIAIVVSLYPIGLSSGTSINMCYTTMLMAGFLGGGTVAFTALAVTAAFKLAWGYATPLDMVYGLTFTLAGLALSALYKRASKRYPVVVGGMIGAALMGATSGLMPPAASWYSQPQGWLVVSLLYLGGYLALRVYLVMRANVWRRRLYETVLRTGSTRLLVFTEAGRLVLSSRPVRTDYSLIAQVRDAIFAAREPLASQVVAGKSYSTIVAVNQTKHRAVYHASYASIPLSSGALGLRVVLDEVSAAGTNVFQPERFFSLSADGMAILDTGACIRIANPALADILGYSTAELKTLSIKDIIHPDSLEEIRDRFREMSATGVATTSMVAKVLAKDGTYRTLSWSASLSAQEGLIYVVARDVTEHKKYETAMAQLASIVEQAEYAIISLTTSGRVLTWNGAAQTLWGYTPGEVHGVPISDLVDHGQRQHVENILAEVVNTGLTKRVALHYRQSSGFTADLIATVSPLRNESGTICGLSVIARDYTRQRAMEQEMARLGRLDLAGQMAAGIGHEIRNPMTTVRGFLQLFQSKPDLANYHRQFQLIISELDRCNFIITEFLSLSKNRPVCFRSEQLNDIITTLEPLIQADALMADISLNLELRPIPAVLADAKEIRQLILNLVRNGMEAMAPEGGVLTIATKLVAGTIALEIKDQGSGIPADIAERIGTPFFTTKDSGTGLGLAVCYSIANNHQAKMSFISSSLGTTFTVCFPVHASSA